MWKNELKLTNVKPAQLFVIYAEMTCQKKRQKRYLTFVYKYLHKNKNLLIESSPNLAGKVITKSKIRAWGKENLDYDLKHEWIRY